MYISVVSSKNTFQFFLDFNEEEEEIYKTYLSGERSDFETFENQIKKRVADTFVGRGWETVGEMQGQLYGKFNDFTKDIDVRFLDKDELDTPNDALVILRFSEIQNVDPTGEETPEGVVTQIHHTSKRTAQFYLNDEKTEWWHMWPYLPEYTADEDMIWPPDEYYEPIITYKDYETFEKNNDDLQKCLRAFQTDMPDYLRKRWISDYQEEILKIERSGNVIQAFNRSIGYPGWGGAAILDDIFTCVEEDELDMLSDDTYTVLGYFYNILMN